LGTCLLAGGGTANAGWVFGHPYWSDHYYITPPFRTHAPQLPLRARVEYSPTIITPAPPSHLSTRVAAYSRPPAWLYGPAVAAPGPGVPIYGPQDNAFDPADPFSHPPCEFEPAYLEPVYQQTRPIKTQNDSNRNHCPHPLAR
jgi:hypothetical protein